ncbi:MAG TPA: BsuPI-related putative proteinase inhibitor [Bryobacteraceae bacterium]|nr:BsuPI-related putative proteinase inhibitor [Bryobacteraceae bacterium]
MWRQLLWTFALAGSLAGSHALAQDYFPLQAGNEWVYRASGSRSAALTVRVSESRVMNGQTWYVVEGFRGGSTLLRSDGLKVFERAANGSEQLWYDFGASIRQEYVSALPGGKASVLRKDARYAGPVGEGNNAVEIFFPGLQVGVTNEKFLPYIGMVSRTVATGGPAVAFYDLVYARLGGVTILKEKTIDFALTLEQPSFSPGDAAMARLLLRNDTGSPLPLQFRDGQTFDLVVRDGEGNELYRWSAGKQFTQALRSESIEGERQWGAMIPVPDAPGTYTLEGFLTSTNASYRSSLAFEVKARP